MSQVIGSVCVGVNHKSRVELALVDGEVSVQLRKGVLNVSWFLVHVIQIGMPVLHTAGLVFALLHYVADGVLRALKEHASVQPTHAVVGHLVKLRLLQTSVRLKVQGVVVAMTIVASACGCKLICLLDWLILSFVVPELVEFLKLLESAMSGFAA